MRAVIFFMLLFGTCMAKDLYLTPIDIISADTFIARGQAYKIDGIQPPTGEWGRIAAEVMELMIRGKEFKFLHSPSIGKNDKFRHVIFAVFGKDNIPQQNPALKLLQMGLVQFNRGQMEPSRAKSYYSAEKYAKDNRLGIWSK